MSDEVVSQVAEEGIKRSSDNLREVILQDLTRPRLWCGVRHVLFRASRARTSKIWPTGT